jgi:hypothetical protein
MPVLVSKQKAEFERFERNMKWFHDNYEKLKAEYAGEYVAIDEGRVVGHDRDARVLIKRLRERHEDIGAFVIEFVSKEKMELIL